VSSTILSNGKVAPTNVGVLSAAAGEYNPESSSPGSITTANIMSQSGRRFFAGPRQEGFFVDLEHTFDLLNLGSGEPNKNTLLGKNVHTIALEVPITEVTLDAKAPVTGTNNVIASWATTSRRAATVRRSDGASSADRGNWVQVSRLGQPLVNEAVIPIRQKDIFNASNPINDGQFLQSVQHLELVGLMNSILGTNCPSVFDDGLDDAAGFNGRDDIVLLYLTGFPGINQWPGFALGGPIPGAPTKNYAPFEALREDLTAPAGFPNGRLVGDDVVDVTLSAVCGLLTPTPTSVSDGVSSDGLNYLTSFPFLGDPWFGDDHPSSTHDL
jgi:hypothetical protein